MGGPEVIVQAGLAAGRLVEVAQHVANVARQVVYISAAKGSLTRKELHVIQLRQLDILILD
jgi:hypothetical protein